MLKTATKDRYSSFEVQGIWEKTPPPPPPLAPDLNLLQISLHVDAS